MLFRALGAEDRDRNRSPLRDVVAVDPIGDVVTQPNGLGALGKAALGALFYQCEAATSLPEEIRRARTVSQQRRSSGHEHQAWLVKASGRGLWSDTDDVAQRTRDLRARKYRRQRRNHHAVNGNGHK